MTRVTTGTMTITINSTDYSNFINSVSVSGGSPMYNYKPMWNGRKKRVVTGYNEWNVAITMLVDTTTKTFIDGLTTPTTSYTIVIGEASTVQYQYSNMYVSEFSDAMTTDDGLQLINITFVGEGLPANKV